MDLCGVEAAVGRSLRNAEPRYRRTLVGSKRRRVADRRGRLNGYRRTLVGSKRPVLRPDRESRVWLQTDPRGVEA